MTNAPLQEGKLTPNFGPDAHSVWTTAKEAHGLSYERPVELDSDELAYPDAFCTAAAGAYKIKVVLDLNHDLPTATAPRPLRLPEFYGDRYHQADTSQFLS